MAMKVDGEIRNSILNFILADKKSKERSSSVGGQKKDKKVMELKATMKMYHDELEEAVSFFHFNHVFMDEDCRPRTPYLFLRGPSLGPSESNRFLECTL